MFGTASHYCHRYCIWYTILYLVHTVFGTAYRMNGTHTIYGTHARNVKCTIYGRNDQKKCYILLVIYGTQRTKYGTLVSFFFC